MPTRAGDITRLIATDLSCIRGGRIVFDGLSFAVPAGSALMLTGPNGAGKSSLLRVIAGLVRASAGTVAAEGGDAELTIAEQCHYAGHLDPVKASLSVGENLKFWRNFLGGEQARSIDDALAAVGLGSLADLPGGYLSAGQRRRLSLARLIATHRPIWLLDEPTAALDTSGQEIFETLCAAHLAAGGIVVAATHAPLALPGEQNLALGAAA